MLFLDLPTELIFEIIQYLKNTKSLLNVRIVSRFILRVVDSFVKKHVHDIYCFSLRGRNYFSNEEILMKDALVWNPKKGTLILNSTIIPDVLTEPPCFMNICIRNLFSDLYAMMKNEISISQFKVELEKIAQSPKHESMIFKTGVQEYRDIHSFENFENFENRRWMNGKSYLCSLVKRHFGNYMMDVHPNLRYPIDYVSICGYPFENFVPFEPHQPTGSFPIGRICD